MGGSNSLEAVAQQQAVDVRALVLRGRPGALARFLASNPPDVIASYFNLLADDARSKAAAKLDELARNAPDLHVAIAIARIAARLPLNNDALAARLRGPATSTIAAADRMAEMQGSLADARAEVARQQADGDRLRAELKAVAAHSGAAGGYIAQLEVSLANARAELTRQQAEAGRQQEELKARESLAAAMRGRISDLEVSIADARSTIAGLQGELKRVSTAASDFAGAALSVALAEDAAASAIPDAPPFEIPKELLIGNAEGTAVFASLNTDTRQVRQLGHAIPVPLGANGKPVSIPLARIETKQQMDAILAAPVDAAIVMNALKTAKACNADKRFIWDPNLNSCAVRTVANGRFALRPGVERPVSAAAARGAAAAGAGPNSFTALRASLAARRGAIEPS